MSLTNNPFIRGLRNLKMQRVLHIYDQRTASHFCRFCHDSQVDLPDDIFTFRPSWFCNEYAFIELEGEIPAEMKDHCTSQGVVIKSIWEVSAEISDQHIEIGRYLSKDHAHRVIAEIDFDAGYFNRCWEISIAHIPVGSVDYLTNIVEQGGETDSLFEVFKLPDGVGVLLYDTPWNEDTLEFHGIENVAQLYQKQLQNGVPPVLLDVLHLAAATDIRILIFDRDAPVLAGLPTFPNIK